MRSALINEIVSLDKLRVQKVFGLFNSILVIEFYSPSLKRLYFVVDQNPHTRSLHIQKERPLGFKTKSMLIALLNKYAINQTLRFHKMDEEGEVLKAQFIDSEEDLCLIFESFQKIAVGFFRGSELIASMKKGLAPQFRRGYLPSKQKDSDLSCNLEQARLHEKNLLDHHKQALYNNRIANLRKELGKKETLLKNLNDDLDKCQKNLALAHDAELLKQNLKLIKKGMTSIDVVDYATGSPKTITLSLDPKLSPQELLEKIFHKIKRAKRGIAVVTDRLAQIKNEASIAETALDDLKQSGPNAISFSDITEKLEQTKKNKEEVRLPYREYLSSDKVKILVGKSAKDSDDLTLHHARGNDWWLHAKDVAGAHVVIKTQNEHLPENTLLEAAMLAQHFSKARLHAHAAVHYTRAKFVQKKKGMPSGLVLITKEKTFEFDLDEKLLHELLQRLA